MIRNINMIPTPANTNSIIGSRAYTFLDSYIYMKNHIFYYYVRIYSLDVAQRIKQKLENVLMIRSELQKLNKKN